MLVAALQMSLSMLLTGMHCFFTSWSDSLPPYTPIEHLKQLDSVLFVSSEILMRSKHRHIACKRCLYICRDDDEMRTGLRGHITALLPQEIILPRKGLTATTSKVLRASLRNPRQHQLTPGDKFWDAERTLQEIKESAYFNPADAEQGCLPQALQVTVHHCGGNLDALHTTVTTLYTHG